MRKFFFMVFCMVALLLPESLWAEEIKSANPKIEVDGTTLTITSPVAGELKSFMDAPGEISLASMKACTKIVLKGKFNSNDLSSIQAANSTDFQATEVDMSEAQFVIGTSGSSVPEYQSTDAADPDANVGKIIKVGNTYYQATANTSSWSSVSDKGYGNDTPEGLYYYQNETTLSAALSYPNGTYAAVGTAYTYETERWNDITSTTIFPISFSSTSIYRADDNESDFNNRRGQGVDGQLYVLGKVYYADNNSSWIESNYYGQSIECKVYVDKVAMDGETPTDGQHHWAVVVSKIYQYSAAGWKEAPVWVYGNTFDPKVYVYSNNDNRPANPTDGLRAFVGSYYKFTKSFTWNSITLENEEADYSMMKFTYWSSTLQTAKTSKYADSNISSEIFQNCKKITRIDFLGGHVKGLDNRTTGENNYANFTLFVGKNVTEIEASALNQSTALTGLEFDRTYTEAEKTEKENNVNVYPKELTIGNMAFNGCYNVFNIVIPNRCVSIGNNAFKNVGNGADLGNAFTNIADQKLTLTFERRNSADDSGVGINCDKPLVIGNSAFQDCWYLKDLSLPIRLNTMGEDCFKNTKSLKTLEMREETEATYGGEKLRTIPSGAFYSSAIEDVKIPKCVTRIVNGAFGDTEHLKKLVFQDTDETDSNGKLSLHIESGAFSGGNEQNRPQLDVYVNINPLANPNPGRKVICEYNAFNFTQTVGQTSTSTTDPSFAFLHFPEEAWDYYQGNWKRGLAFRQDNLNAFKDGYNYDYSDSTPDCIGKYNGEKSNISTSTGKYETGNDGTQYTPANGWQEFARTSTAIDIIIDTKGLLRTYSTLKPQAIPVDASNNTPLFKTYRITNFTYNETTKAATAVQVDARLSGENARAYIPANTGFILLGDHLQADYIFYMSDIDTQNTEFEYPYVNDTSNDKANLLYPTCIAKQYDGPDPSTFPGASTVSGGIHVPTVNATEGNVTVYATIPNPYNTRTTLPAKGGLQYHLFGLSSSAAGQFNRIKNGTRMSRDKAYLKLTPAQFPVTDEGANASGSGVTPPANSQAPIMLSFIDSDGNTTDVRMIDPQTMTIMEDCYYTLQGVKLNARPTQQGIYIHNGKKVVIK